MTTALIRKKLHNYIADADDKKIKGMYMLLENEISGKKEFSLNEAHFKILEEEKEKHLKGKSKSYSWEEAKKIIRKKKSKA